MNLISADRQELALSCALPWTLYDRDGNLLLEAGAKLDMAEDADALFALGRCGISTNAR